MNVLFPVDEAAPLYKIGGLGDVGGALPKALNLLGVDVRVIMPYHPEIKLSREQKYLEDEFSITYDRETLGIKIWRTILLNSKVPVYLVEEEKYLSVHTDASDNHADKFAVFSLAVATFISCHSPYWQPHIIHCHDWHTALIPVILQHKLKVDKYKTVITIHNLAYQGVTQTKVIAKCDIPLKECEVLHWDLADGDLNILLEGLLHADLITTVSENYAKEILSVEYGEKIEQILETKKTKIVGVLNGLDVVSYNPETDGALVDKYNGSLAIEAKKKNRQSLQQEMGLTDKNNEVLIGFVGRVDAYQKGIGLIIDAIYHKLLPPKDCQLVFLGTGDLALEQELHRAGLNMSEVRIVTRFDEVLARRIYAASQLVIIPSRFEPCGLVQLIAMRYGTIPVGRATGGLVDTIKNEETGFLFDQYDTSQMMRAINKAISIVRSEVYGEWVNRIMSLDFSWHISAKKYVMLYEQLLMS